MSAPHVLAAYSALAEPRLRAFLETKSRLFAASPVPLADAQALLTQYVLRGGKRLRGALVLLGHRAGGGDGDSALAASIGVELAHAYLLIHDDFMDRDDVRRGGPTLHRSLGGDHLGGSLALLLGSLCQAWAFELVLGGDAGKARGEGQRRAAELLALSLEQVTVGQMADLRAPSVQPLSADEVLRLQQLKTGSYTFEMPLALGAALAGAGPAVRDSLSAFARPLGQAFQIADDWLGTFGAPAVTGKPNASDLREGKRTYLVAHALERGTAEEARALRGLLARGADLSDEDAEAARDLLRRTGAEAAARTRASALCDEALRALDTAALPADVASSLREIAEYAVKRAL